MRMYPLICFFLFQSFLGYTQNENVESKIKAILNSDAFDYSSVGISVRSLSGEELLSIDGDKKLIPASSQKLITTLNALEILGSDYSFKTRVGYTGKIDRAGTLEGDIVIIGSGDPSFGSRRLGQGWQEILSNVVQSISEKGIKCIDGNIEVRTNVFSGQPIPGSWPYEDIANYYGSGSWALNFNENEYDLFFKPKVKEGRTAVVERTNPQIPYLEISSEVLTKGKNTGDNAYIYGDQFFYRKIVRGSIPYSQKSFKIKGSIPNPPLSFACLLAEELEKVGVSIGGMNVEPNPIKKSQFNQLLSFKSKELSKIVRQANYESINLYCESLLRIIGKKEMDEGSIDAGVEIISDRLKANGIDKHSFRLEDGSGLSPRNSITPSSFTAFLFDMSKSIGRDEMLTYIPRTGESGTVKSLLRNRKSQKKFYLKSGSMGGVLSYTGLFQGVSGQWYSICFISNNHSYGNSAVRKKAEDIFDTLYSRL